MEKSRGLRSRLLAGQDFLAYEWEDFTLNPGWSWKRERAQRPVAGTRELPESASWPIAADTPPKCLRCSAGSSIWLQRAQKAEGTSRSLWRPPSPWQTADFGVWWRSSLCEWRGSPNSVILLVYHMLDVEFLIVREHEVRQRVIGLLLEDLTTFLRPSWPHDWPYAPNDAASWKAWPPDRPSTPGAWWICSHRLPWQRFCSFGNGFFAAFPSYFWEVQESRHSVLSCAWSVKGVSGLLERLHDLPHR